MAAPLVRMRVTTAVLVVRVVNRLAGFGMSFLALRLAADPELGPARAGLVLSLFGVATVVSRLLGGALATRAGVRAATVLGLTVAGLAQLGIAVGQGTAALVVAVLALGLAYEIIEPATQAAIVEHAEDARPAGLASSLALMWVAIEIAGIAAGALAALVLPLGLPVLFAVDGASSLAAALLAWLVLPAHTRPPTEEAPTALRHALTRPLLAWTGVSVLYATVVMVMVFMLPLALHNGGHPDWLPGTVLALSATGALVTQRVMRRAVARTTPRAGLLLGHLLLAASLALWATDTPVGYAVGALVHGGAGSLLIGTAQAVAAGLGRPRLAAATMALYGLCWGAATVIAPLIGTGLVGHGAAVLWLTLAGGALLAAPATLAVRARVSGRR